MLWYPAPISYHVSYVGIPERILRQLPEDGLDSLLTFLGKALQVLGGVSMDDDLAHQIESSST
jgi:hypothetical protein